MELFTEDCITFQVYVALCCIALQGYTALEHRLSLRFLLSGMNPGFDGDGLGLVPYRPCYSIMLTAFSVMLGSTRLHLC